MAIIRSYNNLTEDAPKSYLSNGEAVGVGTVAVKNINLFTASNAVQIGKTGEENSEVVLISASAPSGTTLILTGTTRFDHPIDTPVYQIVYDQIIFKCSTTGTAGSAAALTNGTITITPDQDYTQFTHAAGTTGYAYKTQYYNSVTTNTSSESSWIEIAGYNFYSLAKLRERIKDKLFNASYIKSDGVIDDWINEWLEMMTDTANDVNKDYNLGTVDVAIGTSGLGTITSSNFRDVRKILYTTDGSSYYKAQQKDIDDFYPEETFSTNYPFFYYQGDSVIGILPAGLGTARLTYYKLPTQLSNETDELPVPMRAYTSSFVDYALSQCFYLDNKEDKGDRYANRANTLLGLFRDQIASRHKSGAEGVSLVEELNGEDEFWW